jgi:hypothetical protein
VTEGATQTGLKYAAVSDWVAFEPTEEDPEYSHAGVTVCQRCEAIVTVRVPRGIDSRSRLRKARTRIITSIAVPLTLVLIALFLIVDPLHFDRDGLIVLGTFLGLFSGVVLLVSPASIIRQALTTSPLTTHHESDNTRDCGHFAY